jgi:type II secretory pathway predicted ATPase ExeA
MLLDHFNLREQPFGVSPDPRFFFPSTSHREAMASLLYGVQSQRAFMAMIAQPGMGKTMLLFNLLQQLGSGARTAFLFLTQCDSREFLAYLLMDLGLKVHDYDPIRMHEELKGELLKEARAGRQVVVVVDEAQNLSTSVLETIRLLSDFENPQRKLMQIILAGQPQLAEKIASPELLQLRQRLSLIMQIKPLSREEVATYIARRLQVAGHTGAALFTAEAVGHIAARSGGIPRVINNYCFNSLSIAFATGKQQVDADMVVEVARDLDAIEQVLHGTQAGPLAEISPIELPVLAPDPKSVISMPVAPKIAPGIAPASSVVRRFETATVQAAKRTTGSIGVPSARIHSRTPFRELPPTLVMPIWLRRVVILISPRASQSLQRSTHRTYSGTVLRRLRDIVRRVSRMIRTAREYTAGVLIPRTRQNVTRVSALAVKCAFAVPLLLLEKSEAEDSATVNLSRNPQSELPAATPANWCGDGSPTVQLSGCKAEGVNV